MDTEALDRVRSVAAETRRRFVEHVADNPDTDLWGHCYTASCWLIDPLREAGFYPVVIRGDFRVDIPVPDDDPEPEEGPRSFFTLPHCWVELDGVIVDITATQFQSYCDKGPKLEIVYIADYAYSPRYTKLCEL
jgi:hypothetical protein